MLHVIIKPTSISYFNKVKLYIKKHFGWEHLNDYPEYNLIIYKFNDKINQNDLAFLKQKRN